MADSSSPIQQIQEASGAVTRVNENFDATSPAMLYARDARTTSALTWGYIGGRYASAVIASGVLALTASSTNYVVADRTTGVVTASTSNTNWESSSFLRLYLVVTGASTVSSYQDHRQAIGASGGGGGGGSVAWDDITDKPAVIAEGATEAAARAEIDAQATLVSGSNIKTLNGVSLLGSGNIDTGGGGGGGAVAAFSDPAHQWYGPSQQIIAQTASEIKGDPVLIRRGPADWLMLYFGSFGGTAGVRQYYRTATSLEGPWSAETQISSLDGYHKLCVLVDVEGLPVLDGGLYHGYAVAFAGDLSDKVISHFTAADLTGPWTSTGVVIPKGASGTLDEFNTDTPFAVLSEGMVHLWYMGAPASSQPTYALAVRMLRATAADPAGPFTKDYTDVLLPSTTGGAWDYGWMGGTQIRRRPDGTYLMVYNAGNTRPASAGAEPAASAIGYAYASSLEGPWSKDPANPYVSITGSPSDALEKSNVWRGHVAFDDASGRWYLFYNTGAGTETITMARQGAYDYSYGSGPGSLVQVLTTSVTPVTNSRVNLTPGVYAVRAALNLIADSGGTLPKLNIDLTLRLNGVEYRTPSREFIGSYAYENRDVVLQYFVFVGATGYVDLALQVTEGVPTSQSEARRLRLTVQRMS